MIKLKKGSILDILPTNITYNNPKLAALAYALKCGMQVMLQYMDASMVYADIDSLPEEILDEMAVEMRAQYYNADLPIAKKRTIVKNAMNMYSRAGTPAAVQDMITYIFGSGELVEWFDNPTELEPGEFEINTTVGSDEVDFDLMNKVIDKVKNISSHLKQINFGLATTNESYVGIGLNSVILQTIK